MSTRAIERVDDWETRPFGGGHRGLHDLADEGFSGVVRSPAGTLCMLNGAVVGILGGTIEDFADADGTAYEAPTPALPLLIVMQDRDGEVRAKYYTEDTPLSKVDSTLSDGGFTGYIELSENVLSGDYYVVYQGGRSMSVAFVGNSGQLLSDEEAFERADDEVGIYQVRSVDVETIEIPEVDEPEPAAGAATTGTDETTTTDATDDESTDAGTDDADATTETPDAGGVTGGTAAEASATEEDDSAAVDDGGETQPATGRARTSAGGTTGEAATQESPRATGTAAAGQETEPDDSVDHADSDRTGGADATPRQPERDRTAETADAEPEPRQRESEPTADAIDAPAEPDRDTRTRRPDPSTEDASSGAGATGVAQESERGTAADLETRTIPSLDPDRTWSESDETDAGRTATATSRSSGRSEPSDGPRERTGGADKAEAADDRSTASTTSETSSQSAGRSQPSADRVRDLEETIADREERIDDLEAQLETAREERDQAASERDDLRAARDELASERDELQAELERLRGELADLREQRDSLQARLEEADADVAAETRLARGEAMDRTDLFVRYDSKGEPTLKTAHDSGASRSDVNENLNVEYHTQFETDGAVVGGRPFDAFLRSTIEYRFVSWFVRELLFEIRDTGHRNALADLYDAIPSIDRAELNGEATVEYTEDGQTKRSSEAFDVVLRDRMGNPLVVANFNDTREAATEDDMRSLVTSATRVGESTESLAGAMFVTASFFEPEALETASESTGGGLLSRDKRESYVKVSRKRGYHLCLVEARDEQFHMAVPEL